MSVAALLADTMLLFGVFSTLVGLTDLHSPGLSGDVVSRTILASLLSGSCVGALYVMNLYDFKAVRTFPQFLSRAPGVLLIATVSAGLLCYALLPAVALSWPGMAALLLIMLSTVLAGRAVWYRVLTHRPVVEHVLVLGRTELARSLVAELEKYPRFCVLHVADPWKAGLSREGTPMTFIPQFRARGMARPHRIVVAMGERRGRLPMQALLNAKRQGIVIEDGVQLFERLTGCLALDCLQPSHLIFSRRFHASSRDCALPRLMSVSLAAIGLLVSAPLFGLIALLVKLDSPGPVLFVQARIGRDGRRFPLMKFRTMHPAEKRPSEWVKDNGDRITRVGRWLRKFRLDELPQLVNVLVGHMNLVGPRPHPASNYALFTERIPFYSFRSMVRPGITGWAQVRYGYANNLEEETEKMRYDLYYIKHRSILLDLEILARTVQVVIQGRDMKLAGPSTPAERLQEHVDAA